MHVAGFQRTGSSPYLVFSAIIILLWTYSTSTRPLPLSIFRAANELDACGNITKEILPRVSLACPNNQTMQGNCSQTDEPSSFGKSCIFEYNSPVFEEYWLPPVKDNLYRTCAVVSTSSSLLGSGCGKSIDDNDVVMRVNNAPIASFQRDVGERHTFNLLNSHVARKLWAKAKTYDFDVLKYVCSSPASFILAHDEWSDEARRDYEIYFRLNSICPANKHARKILLVAPSFRGTVGMVGIFGKGATSKFFSGVLKDNNVSTSKGATTGLQAIMLALSMCKKVKIYGFGEPLDEKRVHYYDEPSETEQATEEFHKFHDFDVESMLIHAWAKAGFASIRYCDNL